MINSIKRILNVSGKYKARIEFAFIFSFFKSLLQNAALVLAVFMVNGFMSNSLVEKDFIKYGIVLLSCVLLQAVCINIADRLQSGAGFMLMADLRIKLGEHLRRLPMGYFTSGNIGKISSVLSTDMVFIEENSMMTLADTISDFFSAIIFVIFMLVFNPVIGVVALVGTITMILIGEGKFKSGISLSLDRQEQSEKLTNAVLDYVEGIGITKTYNLLGDKSTEMKKNFDKSCEESLRFENIQVPWGIAVNIAFEILSAAIAFTAVLLFLNGNLSLTYFLGTMLFVLDIFIPLRVVYMDSEKLTIMDKCLDRIDSVMNELELSDDSNKKVSKQSLKVPTVEFRNVRFSYDSKETISNVSFKVMEGQTIALVGPSGSGKTTLANLMARFWDIDSGEILINGTSIKNVALSSLLEQISMVFQNVYLFRDTIYNNIAMGRPEATKDEIIEAAKKARCYDFIMSLPDGFETMVGEGGASLSGGEKQRISIARCILKDSPIVILDEATASIDADNEAAIQQAISELCKGKTLIIIAHRLKTIKDADCILVVNDGKIIEKGSHEQLMEHDGLYKNFVQIKNSDSGWCKRKIG
ncbi:MAG: ABC transporter ATP-binding protein [Pseudobutyrivibrio sp.]|uniref:ABC transporter ATP-binding protein n=1 Tax=Pseudobutyrivibrio sp. TaxID=2014367 RepID=UPI0025EE7F29|nr:ABC transporter ATP-binding protein [Pseudobutyrivibrio sp.]MBQ8488291.1 ABC transporter ATP-binding protein [Pseudobutyrivibrio sp.]